MSYDYHDTSAVNQETCAHCFCQHNTAGAAYCHRCGMGSREPLVFHAKGIDDDNK